MIRIRIAHHHPGRPTVSQEETVKDARYAAEVFQDFLYDAMANGGRVELTVTVEVEPEPEPASDRRQHTPTDDIGNHPMPK